MTSILIKNAQVVNEGSITYSDILIKGPFIEKIDVSISQLSFSFEEIDATGLILIPGMIDDQVHFREPGLTHKGNIYTESRAAVAGGITSYMDMPNTVPPTTSIQALNEKFQIASKSSLANYSFFIGATNDNLDDLLKVDPARTCGIKVFLGASTGNMLVEWEAFEKIVAHSPLLKALHCEKEEIVQANLKKFQSQYGDDIPVEYHPRIRSEEACYQSTKEAIEIAYKYKSPVHILHVSTARELDLFVSFPDINQKLVTAEACIHHLWFDESDYQRLGKLIKWNPAIKSKKDKSALQQALTNGKLDIIATDHAPHTMEEKRKPYTKSPSGGPLVQHALPALFDLWKNHIISLEEIVRLMAHNPAKRYQIDRRGFVREGYYADLVLIDPEKSWEVKRDNLLYKCGWSPYLGHKFQTSVVFTIINGNLVFENGSIKDDYRGMALEFLR